MQNKIERPPGVLKRNKSVLKLGLRTGVSLALAAFIYFKIDTKAYLHALESLSLTSVAVILVLYTFGQLLSAWKWKIFVSCAGIERTPVEIIRCYFFGMFVNVFGLGTVGGDVARGLLLNPPKGQRAAALATVIADRIHGLGILLAIGAVAMTIVRPAPLEYLVNWLSIGGIAGVILWAGLWWLGPSLLIKYYPRNHKWRGAMMHVAGAFPRQPGPFFKASALSFLCHNIQLFIHVIIAHELGANLSASYIWAAVPFVNIVASLPFSVMNGLGVRETMYCMLLIPAGVPREIAVAFGTIWLLTVTIISSVGILLLTPDMKRIVRKDNKEFEPLAPEVSPQRAVG